MVNHIKIHGVKPRIQYVANGNLKKYEFPFAIFKTSDVDVYLDDKLLTISEYEVSVEPDIEGGAISFKVAPSNGTVITIARNLSIERTTDFQEGGALRANVLNDELDYQIACQQQIADSLNRSMVLPPYAVDTDVDLTLPTPSAGKAIVWNADGTNLENSTVKVNELESTLKQYKEVAEAASKTAVEKAQTASDKAQVASQKADEATEILDTKANSNMDNLSVTGKENIISLGMPDFSAGISKTKGIIYQAECDGFLHVFGTQKDTAHTAISLEIGFNSDLSDAIRILNGYSSPNTNLQMAGIVPVVKGMYYTLKDATHEVSIFNFYPAKGAI